MEVNWLIENALRDFLCTFCIPATNDLWKLYVKWEFKRREEQS